MHKLVLFSTLALGLLCGLLFVELCFALFSLPNRIPVHFDSNGKPNAYSSKYAAIFLSGLISYGISLMFYGIGIAVSRVDMSSMNLPNREFWISSTARSDALRVFLQFIFNLHASFFLAFSISLNFSIHTSALSGKSLSMGFFISIVIIYMISVLGLTISMIYALGKRWLPFGLLSQGGSNVGPQQSYSLLHSDL